MLLVFASLASVQATEPIQVQAVYLLPMSNGMDQYLAQRLTSEAVFPVVTDPKLADAVMTDQIGATFERRLQDLYPPVAEDAPQTDSKDPKDPKDKQAEDDAKLREELKLAGGQRPTSTGFSRGQGNYFLVDLKSRRVLWSVHERPKNVRPQELERSSGRIVSQLKRALGRK